MNGYFETHLKEQIKSVHQHSPCKGDDVQGPSHIMRLTSFIEELILFEASEVKTIIIFIILDNIIVLYYCSVPSLEGLTCHTHSLRELVKMSLRFAMRM